MSNFGAGIPTSQKRLRLDWIVHNPHYDLTAREAVWASQNYRRVISIDPGKRNLCIRIEKRPTDPSILYIETEVYVNIDLEETMNKETHTDSTFSKIRRVLDMYFDYIINTHFIIIENQLDVNTKCVVVQTNIITYMEMMLANTHLLPLIISVEPKLKTRMLGDGRTKNLNKNGIKLWSVKEARRILTRRGDQFGLEILENGVRNKKADDLGDVVCQVEALFMLLGLPITPREDVEKHQSIDKRANNMKTHVPAAVIPSTLNDFMENKPAPSNNGNYKLKLKVRSTRSGTNTGTKSKLKLNIVGNSTTSCRTSVTVPSRRSRVMTVPTELLGNKDDFQRRLARQRSRTSAPTTPNASSIAPLPLNFTNTLDRTEYEDEVWLEDEVDDDGDIVSDDDDDEYDDDDIYAGLV